MIISEEWTGRIENKKPDESKMGRWIQCTIRGKDNRKVTMITAYQVVKQSITQAGPKTAYMQQYQRLRLTGHADPNPRKQFINDLGELLRKERDKGNAILLMLDANDSMEHASSLSKLASEFGLIDLHTHKWGLEGEPSTYKRGTKRIDYILGTEEVAQHLRVAGIEAFDDGVKSDHRGLFVDIDMKGLLGCNKSNVGKSTKRHINSKDPELVKNYRKHLLKYWEEHKVEERIRKIKNHLKNPHLNMTETRLKKKLEKLDRDMTRSMLQAERKCEKRYPKH